VAYRDVHQARSAASHAILVEDVASAAGNDASGVRELTTTSQDVAGRGSAVYQL